MAAAVAVSAPLNTLTTPTTQSVSTPAALFAEAGSAHAAAELCFEHELLEPLAEIVDRLLRESDSGGGDLPVLRGRCIPRHPP